MADEQRTLALGLQSVMFRAFGSVPGPLVFGAIFDSACVYFHYECGNQANCWVYDNHLLSTRAIVLASVGLFLNFVFSFLTWLFYPKHTQGTLSGSVVSYINGKEESNTLSVEDEMVNIQGDGFNAEDTGDMQDEIVPKDNDTGDCTEL